MAKQSKMPAEVQSVVLALRLLERLAAHHEPLGVTALATALETTKNRTYRHLRTLLQQGYVAQLPSEKYCIGSRLISFGRSAVRHDRLTVIADPHMRELRDTLGYGVALGQMEPDGLRVAVSLPGRTAVHIAMREGGLAPLHATAMGKVALAFGPESLREKVFRGRLAALTPRTIVRHAALQKEIQRVQQLGWATAPDELLIGLNAITAPIFDAAGQLSATVGIVDSVQFIAPSPSAIQVTKTLAAAQRISASLG
jgi:DNA-binding IclR family transcriptional regulator